MTRRGLTLLELLLVLGILGVFLGLALPLLSPNRLALDQAARSLATQVTRARLEAIDRKSTRLNSSHVRTSRMPSSA